MSTEHDFLQNIAQMLVRLRDASEEHGYPLLASLLEMARAEAEDEQRTAAISLKQLADFKGVATSCDGDSELDRELAQELQAHLASRPARAA